MLTYSLFDLPSTFQSRRRIQDPVNGQVVNSYEADGALMRQATRIDVADVSFSIGHGSVMCLTPDVVAASGCRLLMNSYLGHWHLHI